MEEDWLMGGLANGYEKEPDCLTPFIEHSLHFATSENSEPIK